MKQLLALLIFLFVPLVAAANDAQLYDPKPPADSAFVRIINGNQAIDAAFKVGTTEYGKVSYPALSDYRIIKAGKYNVAAGDISQPMDIKAGHYYSIAALADGSLKLFDEELLENPAKAKIYFFNLSDAASATLVAPAFNTDIIKALPAGSHKARDINAVTLTAQMTADGTTVQEFKDVELKRKSGVSFLLAGKKDNYQSVEVENRVAR